MKILFSLILAVGLVGPSQVWAQARVQIKNEKRPMFLTEIERRSEAEAMQRRAPATEAELRAGRSEAEQRPTTPVGSQISFFEISPSLGSVSIQDKSSFTTGANLSFLVKEGSSVYFEPSVLASFVSGDNNQNATVFHLDAGLRNDFIIANSALVPFIKGAIGPSISSQSNVIVNGDTLSDSYVNAFAGGGLKVLVSPKIAARLDTGLTFQATDPGLYLAGAAVFPL